MSYHAPEITKEFFIIVDQGKRDLSAVILSFIFKQGIYVPIFEFPFVDIEKPSEERNINSLSASQAYEFSIHTHNCLHKLKGCKTLILAGLTKEQKSYLSYSEDFSTLEVPDISTVPELLNNIVSEKNGIVECKSGQILSGLCIALRNNCRLSINGNAPDLNVSNEGKEGLIVIEDLQTVSTVIAMNYAVCIDTDIKIVAELEKGEERKIRMSIEKWRKNKSIYDLAEVQDLIHSRIEGVWFPQYQFATFFTQGIPYTLKIHNVIPCSFVHLSFRMDFFVFNSIFFENYKPAGSAIVFSTPEFVQHDETDIVIQSLKSQEYYVRELIGKNATANSLDMHIRDFFFGLLHISSHGGEIRGARIVRKFNVGGGQDHLFEYDQVVTLAPIPYKEEIPVTIKCFPRKLDGLVFGTKELADRNYSSMVYDALDSLMKQKNKDNVVSEKVERNIPDSCSISCADFDYQAGFDRVSSGYYSPYVFNNSCWSWSGISWEFLNAGIRGYIGTLFAIGTREATASAKMFYDDVFSECLIDSVWKMNDSLRGSNYEDIYVFYGLHFSTLKKGKTIEDSKEQVVRNGIRSVNIWKERLEADLDDITKKRIKQLYDWGIDHLQVHLKTECERFMAEGKKKMAERKKEK